MLFYSRGEESPFPPADGQQIPTVSVVAPGRTTVAGVIHATGTLAARREMPVGVVGEGGRVVSVLVEPGDWVRAGQPLLVIDRSVQKQQAQARRRRSRSRAPTPISRRPISTARSSWSTAASSARPTSTALPRRATPPARASGRRGAVPRAAGAQRAAQHRRPRRGAGARAQRRAWPGRRRRRHGAVHHRQGRRDGTARQHERGRPRRDLGRLVGRGHAGRQRQDLHRPGLADLAGHRSAEPAGHRALRAVLRARRSGPAASPRPKSARGAMSRRSCRKARSCPTTRAATSTSSARTTSVLRRSVTTGTGHRRGHRGHRRARRQRTRGRARRPASSRRAKRSTRSPANGAAGPQRNELPQHLRLVDP